MMIKRLTSFLTAGVLGLAVVSGANAGSTSASAGNDIVDIAASAGSFNTLVTAVKAAGLVDTLKSEGPFTVFAPTDEAFAKLPAGTLEALLADKEALTQVLTYHVVAGKVMAADVVSLDSAVTIQGQSITIKTHDGVKVDNATVIQTDIVASNGVIHVIDAVILPKDMIGEMDISSQTQYVAMRENGEQPTAR